MEAEEDQVFKEWPDAPEAPKVGALEEAEAESAFVTREELTRLLAEARSERRLASGEPFPAEARASLQEDVSRLQKKQEEQEEKVAALKLRTQRVGQWGVTDRNAFFARMYAWFVCQFAATIGLVYTWINVYPLKQTFEENPLQLGFVLLLSLSTAGFFLCGFRRWTLVAMLASNLSVSLLVSLGVLYTDSTFLLESMLAVMLFAAALGLLNLQTKFSYSSGVLLCLVFLLCLVSLWHFIYLPYQKTLFSMNTLWAPAAPAIERLIALILTVGLCCGYMLYYEERAKSQYLLPEATEASIHLYLQILFFIYVMAQLVHFWSVRCRRARRGMDAYAS